MSTGIIRYLDAGLLLLAHMVLNLETKEFQTTQYYI